MATMERPRPAAAVQAAPAPAPMEDASAPVEQQAAAAPEVASAPAPMEVACAPVFAAEAPVEEAVPRSREGSATFESQAPASTTGTFESQAPARERRPKAWSRPATRLTGQERRQVAMEAELYSILMTTHKLEMAYIKGSMKQEVYEKQCAQLLSGFQTLHRGMKDKVPDVRAWIKEQGMNCPLAEERLLTAGIAASSEGLASASFKASEAFITLNDALKLNLTAVDEVLPLIRDLQAAIVAIPNLPALQGLDKTASWLVTVSNMSASDELSEAQVRQLAMDVEGAYNSLKEWLSSK